MTSKRPPWTREEMDARLAELRADPAKAAQYRADLLERTRKAFAELSKRAASEEPHPVRKQITSYFEAKAGVNLGLDLVIGFNREQTHFRFDVWYKTDEEFERDKVSGRQGELAEILRQAVHEIAQTAESMAYFHSHQFVREKCGGNYFNYMR